MYSAIPATFFVACNQLIMTSPLIFKDPALLGLKYFSEYVNSRIFFVDLLYCIALLFSCWYRFRNMLLLPHSRIPICKTVPDWISFIYIFSLIFFILSRFKDAKHKCTELQSSGLSGV